MPATSPITQRLSVGVASGRCGRKHIDSLRRIALTDVDDKLPSDPTGAVRE